MISEILKVGDTIIFHEIIAKVNDIDINKREGLFSCKLEKVVSDAEILLVSNEPDGTTLEKQQCYVVYFYAGNRVYRCSACFISEYIEESKTYISLELISPMEKVQRRMYQRYTYRGKIAYNVLQDVQIHDMIDINKEGNYVGEDSDKVVFTEESLVDIGGGGFRFTSNKNIAVGSLLECKILLETRSFSQELCTFSEVVATTPLAGETNIFNIRSRFVNITEQQRKDVIHFVFLLERDKNN